MRSDFRARKAGTMGGMLIRWHLVGRAAHREDMLGSLDIDIFKVGAAYALPVEGDLLMLPLGGKLDAVLDLTRLRGRVGT